MDGRTYFVGVDGERAVSGAMTRLQVKAVRLLECALEHEGIALTWDAFDDPEEPRTLFQAVLKHREMRIDKGICMADRPSFCVVTARDGRGVRLEYYEGHDALSLRYDVRAPELEGVELPNFMDADPMAYDPIKFLKDTFGIPEDFSKPVLQAVHELENREEGGRILGTNDPAEAL